MPKRPQAADLAHFAERPLQGGIGARAGRSPFNTYLPSDQAARLRTLAWTLSAREGRRVTISELIQKAVGDLLEEHGG